jgi:CheY-like chemotaxis protein
MKRRFIIVDDDLINNKICTILLSMTISDAEIKAFQEPEEGLEFIRKEYSTEKDPAILLLDINMPSMTGWEFMEHFERLPGLVKEQVKVYILSSSVDQQDINKAASNMLIKGFISKPLSQEAAVELAAVLKNADQIR